jgi:hypothetical protein
MHNMVDLYLLRNRHLAPGRIEGTCVDILTALMFINTAYVVIMPPTLINSDMLAGLVATRMHYNKLTTIYGAFLTIKMYILNYSTYVLCTRFF